MKNIYHEGKLIGIRFGNFPKGSVPLTDPNNPVQVLTWNHEKGYRCKPHVHKRTKRVTYGLNECFIVQKGKLRFRLFGKDKVCYKTMILKAGDVYLHIEGGHEVEVLEDCLMFEVKNGPYIEDKTFFKYG